MRVMEDGDEGDGVMVMRVGVMVMRVMEDGDEGGGDGDEGGGDGDEGNGGW